MARVPDTPASSGNRATCDVSELGTCVQVTARGALDGASVRVLREAVRRVGLSNGRVVLLDLSGATVVDAAVVRFASGLHARAAAHGSSLVVIARPRVREQFAAAGADEVRIVEDVESAA